MIQRIEDDEVSEAAVEFELKRLLRFYSQHISQPQLAARMDALREQARKQAIGVRMLINEAWRLNIPVPDKEVDDALEKIVTDAGGPEHFETFLARQNITEELLRESIRDSRRVDRLIRQIIADVKEPTVAEMRAHFETHRQDYEKPERRRAQHILIKPESDTPQAKQKAKARLKDLRKKFTAGKGFSDLAAAYSDCPSGQKAGGSIGWVARGVLTPPFDEALFATAIGEASEVVETALGFHIVLANASEQGGPASFEEAQDSIRELLLHSRRGTRGAFPQRWGADSAP